MDKVKAPGLKWIKRANSHTPIWVADELDVKNGFTPKTVNLRDLADDPEILLAKCNVLQAEMHLWRAGHRRDAMAFDGTIKSLLSIYQRHPESPFQSLKQGSLHPYKHYIGRIEGHIGNRRIESVNGVDIRRWHRVWSKEGKHLAAAATARAVLEAALSFGTTLRLEGCNDLAVIIREARKKLPRSKPRTQNMTAHEVVRAREAAHANKRPSRARSYAFAFETTLRLWDVIGQWVPIEKPGISDIVDVAKGLKWFGLRWEDIGEDLVVHYTPSKTAGTTGKAIVYPLSDAPMVLEEIAAIPMELRKGPIIVSETTGLPYHDDAFGAGWRKDRKKADIQKNVWARDLRASGITEARAADASVDDTVRVAGHASRKMTEQVYDRATLEASERFAKKRLEHRETKR
jgi:hypothetical protein